jgi:hypothetical protein
MQKEKPTDEYGDTMSFVESYGDYLPNSDNIPTQPPRNGVSGISHNGDIYCIDCAKDMDLIEIVDGEIMALVDGETALVPTEKAPWTSKVLSHHETTTQYHCGRHSECVNAVDGENHPYNHTEPIGIGIDEKVIEH